MEQDDFGIVARHFFAYKRTTNTNARSYGFKFSVFSTVSNCYGTMMAIERLCGLSSSREITEGRESSLEASGGDGMICNSAIGGFVDSRGMSRISWSLLGLRVCFANMLLYEEAENSCTKWIRLSNPQSCRVGKRLTAIKHTEKKAAYASYTR